MVYHRIMKRLFFDIILLLSVLIFPWWISIFFVFIGIFIFNNFYEFIISNIIVFSLYSPTSGNITSSPIFFSLVTITSYLLIQFIKEHIILYKNEI